MDKKEINLFPKLKTCLIHWDEDCKCKKFDKGGD